MVAIGGDFSSAGCASSAGVVLSDFDRFYPLDRGLWCSEEDNHVAALIVFQGDLIAGGRFDGCGSAWPQTVARWDGSEWTSVGNLRPHNFSTPAQIFDFAIFEEQLVAVGQFARNGAGESLAGVARFDGEHWRRMGSRPGGAEALAVWNGDIYCGLTKWDGTNWIPLGGSNPPVTALDVVDEGLAIGGPFNMIGTEEIEGAAIYDGTELKEFGNGAWTIEDLAFPYPDYYGVGGFLSRGGTTYMLAPILSGYDYIGLSRLATNNLGASYWTTVPGIFWSTTYGVQNGDLLEMGDRMLVVGGTNRGLIDLPGASGLEVATLSEGQWSPLQTGLGRAESPQAITSLEGSAWLIDAGGLLRQAPTGFVKSGGPTIRYGSLGRNGDRVFVSGTSVSLYHVVDIRPFLTEYDTGGAPVNNLHLELEDGIGLRLAAPWGSGYLAETVPIEEWPSYPPPSEYSLVFIDGSATTEVHQIEIGFRLDALVIHEGNPWFARNGELVRLTGAPTGLMTATVMATFNQKIHALASDGGRLVVGGDFHSVNGMISPHLALYQEGSWMEGPVVDGPVYTMATSEDGVVVIGGDFGRFGDRDTSNLAALNGEAKKVFPNGPDGPVTSIAITDTGILAAGMFTEAGGVCSSRLAEWVGDLREVSIPDPDVPAVTHDALPARLRLHAPFPNPFNPQVTLAFDLPRAGKVEVRVYSLAGRLVRTLAARHFSEGTHEVIWDGKDELGRSVAAGVYAATAESEERIDQRKLTLVKKGTLFVSER